jgi:uncharacterized membrane protein YhdT
MMAVTKEVTEFERTGFVPIGRKDLAPYRMTIPFDWRADPYKDANWCFQLHTLRYLAVYLRAYEATGDMGHLHALLAWFRDWWNASKVDGAKYAWYDMSAGIRAEKIYDLASVMRRDGVDMPSWFDEMVCMHLEVMLEDGFMKTNHNHGLFVAHGLSCLAELLDPERRERVLRRVDGVLGMILASQFDENHVHKEHSPHYHHLVLKSLIAFQKKNVCGGRPILDGYIDGARSVAPNLYLPDGREIPFGDTDNVVVPAGEAAAGSDSGMRLWCRSGYAVYKHEASYFCMTNNFNSSSHKHWDNLSFIYGVAGQDILMDPGKYKYENSSTRAKVVASDSHNTVCLRGKVWDGMSLNRHSIALQGKMVDDFFMISGVMCLTVDKLLYKIRRQVIGNDRYLIVNDFMDSEDKDVIASSRFNVHRSAAIEHRTENSIVFRLDRGFVKLVFKSDLRQPEKCYDIERIPVSYEYGSFENSMSVVVYFRASNSVNVRYGSALLGDDEVGDPA